MNFEDSLYSNERPPLPPKNIFKSAPPLPPKLNKYREFQREIKIPLPNKTKEPSKHLFFNNSSYALTNFHADELICNAGKVCEKKEVYENYDEKIIKIKKNSFLHKIKHILKKSKQNSQSKFEEDSSSVISKNNKYNEVCRLLYWFYFYFFYLIVIISFLTFNKNLSFILHTICETVQINE